MQPVILDVQEGSRTPEARTAARSMAHRLGFDEAGGERVAIVVTEVCTNLLKHAGGGTIVLTAVQDLGIEVLAMDQGPGMASLLKCSEDGFSTTGTPGTGLGAIRRLSSFTDAYSQQGRGTVLAAVVAKRAAAKVSSPRVRGIEAAKPGQLVCGDAWAWNAGKNRNTIMIADGLGHGPDAAAAALCAVNIFEKYAEASPKQLIELIHAGLRHTRGAAVSVAIGDGDRQVVDFAGLGNVVAFVCEQGKERHQLVSMNGTAGLEGRNVFREFSYPWPEGAALVMHSDGLSSRWSMDDYPGLTSRAPALIAGVLFRDFRRGTDDASIAVLS